MPNICHAGICGSDPIRIVSGSENLNELGDEEKHGFMRKLRIAVIDLVVKAPTRWLFGRMMNANQVTSILSKIPRNTQFQFNMFASMNSAEQLFLNEAAVQNSLVIAWLTVSYQAIKVALTNPANALRYE